MHVVVYVSCVKHQSVFNALMPVVFTKRGRELHLLGPQTIPRHCCICAPEAGTRTNRNLDVKNTTTHKLPHVNKTHIAAPSSYHGRHAARGDCWSGFSATDVHRAFKEGTQGAHGWEERSGAGNVARSGSDQWREARGRVMDGVWEVCEGVTS